LGRGETLFLKHALSQQEEFLLEVKGLWGQVFESSSHSVLEYDFIPFDEGRLAEGALQE
jgi:hypothetical protein